LFDVRRFGAVVLTLLAIGCALLPSAAQADRWATFEEPQLWAAANAEAYLRSEPDPRSERLITVRAGTLLRILTDEGAWSQVFDPRTRTSAYVRADLLTSADPPSPYVYMTAPEFEDPLSTVAIATADLPLYVYPSLDPRAQLTKLQASDRESIVATQTSDDGTTWYQTADGYYLPADRLFLASDPMGFGGRWLEVSLNGSAHVVAYDGGLPVRSFYAIKGTAKFPTPIGAWSIVRRVYDETMDSQTLGIPRNGPGGYYLQHVLYTQYFRGTGESLHYNWWSAAWGAPGSHGCLGLSLGDSRWLWDWADIGTPVLIHP
jgi:hypothetical protein